MQGLPKTSYKLILPVIIFFFVDCFCACSDNSESYDSEIITAKAIDVGLESSSRVINKSTQDVLASLNNKLADPVTRVKAEIWYPKAEMVQYLSKIMYAYIENIKMEMKKESENGTKGQDVVRRELISNGKASELYAHLIQYRKDILSVDSVMSLVFGKTIVLTSAFFDSTGTKEQFPARFFGETSAVSALSILSLLQNNVKIAENKLIEFCNNKCGAMIDDFASYSAIFSQSSNIVQAGEVIEIFAGMGEFTRSAMPKIHISGKEVSIGEDGLTHYKFKVPNRPGKYTVPVGISYIDQDGKVQTMEKNIEYTVAERCDQSEKNHTDN